MLQVDIDLALVDSQINRYIREVGVDAPIVVKNTARLLILQLIKLTPPKSLKQGKAAIRRGLRNALGLIDETQISNPVFRDALRRGDAVAVNGILRRLRSGPLAGFVARPFSKELHQGARNARGTVRNSRRVIAVSPADARRYAKEVEKRSGQAKGAFLPALRVAGGTVASWISRHEGRFGSVEDVHLEAGVQDARMTVVNKARGIASLKDSDVSTAIRYRSNAMRKHIDKLLALRAQGVGFTVFGQSFT